MLIRRLVPGMFLLVLAASVPVSGQTDFARQRAQGPYETGLEYMRAEDFAAAARAFQSSAALDPTFDLAYYMLGRAQMAQRNYVAAVHALTRCRDIHVAAAAWQTAERQERQRHRRDVLAALDLRIADAAASPRRGQVAQLEERKRQLEELERTDGPTTAPVVPPYVLVSLGSAYFRAGRLADAEATYLAVIAAAPKTGEAHSNLAVVYMETGRFADAERSVRAAEQTGLRVRALKEEIGIRKRSMTVQAQRR